MRIAAVAVVCLSVAAFVNAQTCKNSKECKSESEPVCVKPFKETDGKCFPYPTYPKEQVDCKSDDECGNGVCLYKGTSKAVCGCRKRHTEDCGENESCWTSLTQKPHGFCKPKLVGICGVERSEGTANRYGIDYGWNSHGSWDNDKLHTMAPSSTGCGQCNDWSNYGSEMEDEHNWICLDDNCETAINKFCNNNCNEAGTKCGKCGWDHNEKRCVEAGRENQVGEFCANFPGHDNC